MPKNKKWTELAVTVSADLAEAVACFLTEEAENGIVEEKSKSFTDAVVLKAYFDNSVQIEALIQRLQACTDRIETNNKNVPVIHEISTNFLEDEDWNKKWKSFFQPIKITDHIVIKPSWCTYWKKEEEIIIELDPGMAFGTGTHPSTRMCLTALEDIIGQINDLKDISLLDVGTGSGILAIAASLLGIKNVAGIDIDHQAVECARKNAKKNSVSDSIPFSTTPLKKTSGSFSIILANILPHILIDMKQSLTDRLDDRGYLVLSGILSKKSAEVISEFETDLTLLEELKEEEWSCLVLRKK